MYTAAVDQLNQKHSSSAHLVAYITNNNAIVYIAKSTRRERTIPNKRL